MNLTDLELRREAIIRRVDWAALGERQGRRLREFGFDEGVAIQPLHKGGWWARDPIAVRIGRMTIALRKSVAERIEVEPVVV